MKKLGASLVICTLLASNNVLAFADATPIKAVEQKQIIKKEELKKEELKDKSTEKKEIEKNEELKNTSIEIIKPDSDYTVTTNEKIVISGKGEEGSSVSVEVYSKKDEIYERTQTKNLEISAIGFFVTEVKLSPGENKIVVKYKDNEEKENEKVKIVKYKKIENPQDIKKDMDELKDKGIKDIFKDIISSVK